MNKIITIGRQFCSGGRKIGQEIAERYGIPFYDKEILKEIAKDSGMSEDLLLKHDEKQVNSLLFSIALGTRFTGYSTGDYDMPINQKIFLIAFDTIRKLASQGPCVFVGRCADYVLKNEFDCLNVFIHAPFDVRVKEVCARLEVDEEKAKDILKKNDKQRSGYYTYYTSTKWGDCTNYNLTVDSSKLGISGSADLIQKYIELSE